MEAQADPKLIRQREYQQQSCSGAIRCTDPRMIQKVKQVQWNKLKTTKYKTIVDLRGLELQPCVTESQEGFDVHVYPGIPSAAIEDFVLDKNEGLAELVPEALKELLKSGQVTWVKCDRYVDKAYRETYKDRVVIKYKEVENDKVKYIELFAGIGGFRCALDSLGAECIMASEVNKECRETYQANFGNDEPLMGDINCIEPKLIPQFDILTGGFPC